MKSSQKDEDDCDVDELRGIHIFNTHTHTKRDNYIKLKTALLWSISVIHIQVKRS